MGQALLQSAHPLKLWNLLKSKSLPKPVSCSPTCWWGDWYFRPPTKPPNITFEVGVSVLSIAGNIISLTYTPVLSLFLIIIIIMILWVGFFQLDKHSGKGGCWRWCHSKYALHHHLYHHHHRLHHHHHRHHSHHHKLYIHHCNLLSASKSPT